MRQELDQLLCEKYPKMMVNRNKGMTETAMCWGFDCGDGWYNILNQLMGNIQHHIDWKIQQHESAIKYNEMAALCKSGNFELFEQEYKGISQEYKERRLEGIIEGNLRTVPAPVPQVTLDQVKEKFGTLRFYYTGGDDVINGMVRMAEAMSGTTCEGCGNVAETIWPRGNNGGIGGWVRTICNPCNDKREERRAAELAEYHAMNEPKKETKNELNYQFIGEDTGHHD